MSKPKRRSFDVADLLGEEATRPATPGKMGQALAAAVAVRERVEPAPDAPATPPLGANDVLLDIPLECLVEHPMQRHRRIDESDVDDMVRSIEAAGGKLTDRILVRPLVGTPERFEIASGHRRTRAARRLGWESIPAIVRYADAASAKRAHLLANEARRDLSDWERACQYHAALHEEPVTAASQRELAALVGKSESHVSRCLAMMQLPAPARQLLDTLPGFFTSSLAVEAVRLARDNPAAEAAVVEEVQALFEAYGTERYRADPVAFRGAVMARLARGAAGARKAVAGSERTVIRDARNKPALVCQATAREVKLRAPGGMPIAYLAAAIAARLPDVLAQWEREASKSEASSEKSNESTD